MGINASAEIEERCSVNGDTRCDLADAVALAWALGSGASAVSARCDAALSPPPGTTAANGPLAECEDGIDNDGDSYIDFPADQGCSGPKNSEYGACQDGADNDGDGHVDHAQDPGCGGSGWLWENPLCDDGIDNDDNGLIDLEDAKCNKPSDNTEFVWGCGMGFELVLPPLLWLRARRVRASRPRG